ncbi:class I SAM-dependent methyltransferase [Niastella caeni]|uniref:Class I SAM-dependent methyltransferase n=1 Tax=Niastella caeni TaxID=2569763 RepID=A0A4S8HFE8_9BACT|nr:class I SAM-dependent methyltransferase [Niastella caeni]THU33585.1 class I SAM-dependent methyltransferase [Niastella caeni]
MIALLKTTERTNNLSYINNYVFQRHLFAYQAILKYHVAGKHVLELGCGEGYGMELLSPHADLYMAVDKKKPQGVSFNNKVLFKQCHLPFLYDIKDNAFDTVICFQVIEHIKNDHRLLDEIKRVLKPGGTLFLTTPNKLTSLTRNPFHIREYLPVQMQQLIASHFDAYTLNGIYGNDVVMKYYEENRRAIERITRFDVLNLQHRLPAFLLKGVYSVLNNYNRFSLARKAPDITAGINYDDFYRDELSENCLDYFVTASKPLHS